MQLVKVSIFCGLLFTTVHSYSRQEMSIERGGGKEGRRGRRKGDGEGSGEKERREEEEGGEGSGEGEGNKKKKGLGKGKERRGEGNHLDSSLCKQTSKQEREDKGKIRLHSILSLHTGAASQLSVCMEPHGLPAARRVHYLHLSLQLHGHWNKSECHAHPDGERGRLETFQHISSFKLDLF